ncbi:MAG: MFS transporter [Pseudomonadota bacterium]
MNEERIAAPKILIFSLPSLGAFMASTLVTFYLLKFATDVLLIAPAIVGWILLVARFWDAVTDPAVGWLSDRTRTSLGRRRPWFLGSALPLAGSVIMLWSPPADLSPNWLAAWLAVAVLLFYTAFTAFRVPHLAMGAELSRGYHDRSRVFGVMQVVECLGMFAAAGSVVLLEQADDPRAVARQVAVVIAVLATVLILIAVWQTRERADFQGRGGASPRRTFTDVLTNPHARILIGVFFLEQLGFGALVALIPYLSDYVLLTQGSTGIYLFGAIGATIVSIPLWLRLAKRVGKREAWMASIAIKAALLALVWLAGPGDFWLMLLVSSAVGLMNGCGFIIGPSLKADVVDWDEARTGERKEGAYFAAWNFVQKAAGGAAVWVVGLALGLTGFVPNAQQGDAALLAIIGLASVLPIVCYLLALVLMWRFTLDEAAHAQARAQAAARDADSAAVL